MASAAIMFSMATVLTKRWGIPEGMSSIGFTGWTFLLAGLTLLPVTLLIEGLPDQLTARNVGGLIYLVLISGIFAYALWASRQIDDQRRAAATDHCAGDHGEWRLLQPCQAHRFGHPRDFFVDDGACGVGGDISWTYPGPTGGGDYVHTEVISVIDELLLDEFSVIRDHLIGFNLAGDASQHFR
jgi:hypothetical protein